MTSFFDRMNRIPCILFCKPYRRYSLPMLSWRQKPANGIRKS